MQEARAQARLDHPHVCKGYEVGEPQGQAYLAMQYIAGSSLDKARATLSLTESSSSCASSAKPCRNPIASGSSTATSSLLSSRSAFLVGKWEK